MPARVTYRAPEECPEVATFIERIASRAPIHTSDAEDALHLEVELSLSGKRARGNIAASSDEGVEAREVTAASCAEVADALALIAALYIERAQRKRAERTRPVPVRLVSAPEPEPAPPAPRAALDETRVELGLAGIGTMPVTSTALLGAELSLRLEKGLAYAISVSYAENSPVARDAEYTLGVLSLAAGLPAFPSDAAVRFSVALAGRGGFLTARALDADRENLVRRGYLALGVSSRLSADLSATTLLFLDAGLWVSLHQRRFHTREPYVEVGSTLPIAPSLGVGFALSL